MAELLLEILSEEIPARMQLPMAEQLRAAMEEKLNKEQLFHTGVKTYVTPRRIALSVGGLSLTQEDSVVEKRGPKTDAPKQAIEGFLRSTGLSLEQLTQRPTDKGTFYFAVQKQKGQPTKKLVGAALGEILPALTWPKSMRWGAHTLRWVRPIHSIICVFGGEILPLSFGHLEAGNESEGHRFLSKGKFSVEHFEEYRKELERRFVILDTARRKEIILEQAQQLAGGKGLVLIEDDALLTEVAGLVEYPVVLMGAIDQEYMSVPEEVLICSIRHHQKYFCLRDKKGRLAQHFLFVSNMKTKDGGAHIVAGNERVLRARLADARFFWEQDRARPLESRMDALAKVVFHARLGTMAEKAERLEALCKIIAVWVPRAELRVVERAGLLAKADLVTGMVGEFPELQGIMGAYYAREAGEKPELALAIREHYAPVGPSDACPTAPVSVVVAIADKIDTLVGLFAAGEKPTGSKDPFALRRAALGLIRLILENKLSIPLRILMENALMIYPKSLLSQVVMEAGGGKKTKKIKAQDVVEELLSFFEERLKYSLKAENVRHDLIAAVFASGSEKGEDDLLRAVQRVAALERFLATEDGMNLLAAYRRAVNIVAIEEKKDGKSYTGAPGKGHLTQPEELALFEAIHQLRPGIKASLEGSRFEEAMEKLSSLRAPIDRFFEKVTVNCDNPDTRKNRLKLLAQLRELLDAIADFSVIEG